MRTLFATLVSLVLLPALAANATADGTLVDAAYEEATATADHAYAVASGRADAEGSWSAGAAERAQTEAPLACFGDQVAYADDVRRGGEENATAADADAQRLARGTGETARGERNLTGNGSLARGAAEDLAPLVADALDGDLARNLSRADGPLEQAALRALDVATDAALDAAPCHAFARNPLQGEHGTLVHGDVPYALAQLDGALAHAGSDARTQAATADAVAHAERAARDLGADPYAPAPSDPGDLNDRLEAVYQGVCAGFPEVPTCS